MPSQPLSPSPMTNRQQVVRDNLARIRERVAEAAHAADRPAESITLVGVTKYVDAPTAALLLEAGCRDLGESRPQALWEKAATLEGKPVRWHQVGHLQRNKVDQTLRHASLIHAVDSRRLLAAINSSAARQDMTARVLLEVNISGDAAKHGFSAADMPTVVATLGDHANVQVLGLMAMAAREGGHATARENFAALRRLRDNLRSTVPEGHSLSELSMGMSGDFEEAIAEGSTLIRVGSALWEGLGI